jgi:thioredoxin reductase (NADPH)
MLKHVYDFDLFVIGGGSGGLAAAKYAKKLGKAVGIADFVKPSTQGTTWGIGGTCVNVGCIPKKLMHRVAMQGETIGEMIDCGWPIEAPKELDWGTMMQRINTHIKSLNFGYRKDLMSMGIQYFKSLASLQDKNTIKLEDANGEV